MYRTLRLPPNMRRAVTGSGCGVVSVAGARDCAGHMVPVSCWFDGIGALASRVSDERTIARQRLGARMVSAAAMKGIHLLQVYLNEVLPPDDSRQLELLRV